MKLIVGAGGGSAMWLTPINARIIGLAFVCHVPNVISFGQFGHFAAATIGHFVFCLGLTHLFQTGKMLTMQKDFTFGFYFYFFGKPLRPQQAEEVCLS